MLSPVANRPSNRRLTSLTASPIATSSSNSLFSPPSGILSPRTSSRLRRETLALRNLLCETPIRNEAVQDFVKDHPDSCKTRFAVTSPNNPGDSSSLLALTWLCCRRRHDVSLETIRKVYHANPKAVSAREVHANGSLPLHMACWYGADLELIQFLHQSYPFGAQATNAWKELPLHAACKGIATTRVELLEFLIQHHKPAILQVNQLGQLPIHCLLQNNKNCTLEAVSFLLEQMPTSKPLEFWQDANGNTPLHLFCASNHRSKDSDSDNLISILEYVLERHPEWKTAPNHQGWLPLHFACTSTASSTVPLLQRLWCDSVTHPNPLHLAATTGRLETVRFVHRQDPTAISQAFQDNPNAATTTTTTQDYPRPGEWPLHVACRQKPPTFGVIAYLVACQPNALQAVTRQGETPLTLLHRQELSEEARHIHNRQHSQHQYLRRRVQHVVRFLENIQQQQHLTPSELEHILTEIPSPPQGQEEDLTFLETLCLWRDSPDDELGYDWTWPPDNTPPPPEECSSSNAIEEDAASVPSYHQDDISSLGFSPAPDVRLLEWSNTNDTPALPVLPIEPDVDDEEELWNDPHPITMSFEDKPMEVVSDREQEEEEPTLSKKVSSRESKIPKPMGTMSEGRLAGRRSALNKWSPPATLTGTANRREDISRSVGSRQVSAPTTRKTGIPRVVKAADLKSHSMTPELERKCLGGSDENPQRQPDSVAVTASSSTSSPDCLKDDEEIAWTPKEFVVVPEETNDPPETSVKNDVEQHEFVVLSSGGLTAKEQQALQRAECCVIL